MRYIIYQDLRGEWRWRLVAGNNRILADSAESYTDQYSVEEALGLIMKASRAGIEINYGGSAHG